MLFFFSSRRRHTRCSRDWSSDVCSSDLETHMSRYLEYAPLDVNRRNPNVFAKPARVEIGGSQCVADALVAGETKPARKARHMVRNRPPVAFFELNNPRANLFDCPCYLVAENERGFFNPVPLHDVASADAARLDLNEQLEVFYLRHGAFLDPYVPIVVIYGSLQKFLHPETRY